MVTGRSRLRAVTVRAPFWVSKVFCCLTSRLSATGIKKKKKCLSLLFRQHSCSITSQEEKVPTKGVALWLRPERERNEFELVPRRARGSRSLLLSLVLFLPRWYFTHYLQSSERRYEVQCKDCLLVAGSTSLALTLSACKSHLQCFPSLSHTEGS